MMEKIEATFRIVTPMFIGGADQSPSDGIRPPSVKGALRFWWRALNWGRFLADTSGDDSAALRALYKEEASLFGRSAGEVDERQVGGQGSFLLGVTRIHSLTPRQSNIRQFSGKAYLAGMGLGNRKALPEGTDFRLVIRFRPKLEQGTKESVKEALRLFGLMGGLGSRNRRGFGSVVELVQDRDDWRLPTEAELDEDCAWLKAKFIGLGDGSSPFSALDARSRFYRSKSDYDNVDGAMEDVGKLMSRYRTNGTSVIRDRSGQEKQTAPLGQRIVGNETVSTSALRFFANDHNQVHAIASSQKIDAPNNVPPMRSIFGLPHPYRFSSINGTKVSFDFVPSWQRADKKGRRASPLFVHVAAFNRSQGQVKYRALLLLLPARFLPAHAQLDVSVNGSNVGKVPCPEDYATIHDFLSASFSSC